MTAQRRICLAGITAIVSSRAALRRLRRRHRTTVKAAAKPEPLASRRRRSRAGRSIAICASPDRSSPTNRRKSAPRAAGRVIAAPVERGIARRAGRGAGADLAGGDVGPAARGGGQRRADRSPARPRRRARPFDPKRVPDVMNAKASLDLAEAEFARIKSLLDQKVVSQSEYDQRRAQVDAARQQYQMAQNVARAVVSIARGGASAGRARAQGRRRTRRFARRSPDSSPSGVVSVGDYVTRGAHVATVVRVDPMRIELTVPEQAVSLIKVGQPVRVAVDAYPGETFTAKVRYVSPSLRADQRALTVEAVAANPDGRLKPGLFATALDSAAAVGAGAARPGDRRRDGRRHQPRLRRQGRQGRGADRHARRGRRPAGRDHERRRRRATSSAAAPKGRSRGRHWHVRTALNTLQLSVYQTSDVSFTEIHHAVARSDFRQASRFCQRPDPVAHRHRRVRLHAASASIVFPKSTSRRSS